MRRVGIEPTRPEGQRLLRPPRLPVPTPPRASNCSPALFSDPARKRRVSRLSFRSPWRPRPPTTPSTATPLPAAADPDPRVPFRRAGRRLAPRQLRQDPHALARPLPGRADARDGLRADRARLLAGLRHPRADQLRPRRRLHARRRCDASTGRRGSVCTDAGSVVVWIVPMLLVARLHAAC